MPLYEILDARGFEVYPLNKDAPIPRRIAVPSDGCVVAIPQVGELITGTDGRPSKQPPHSFRQTESPLETAGTQILKPVGTSLTRRTADDGGNDAR